jgi:hypothetical protein
LPALARCGQRIRQKVFDYALVSLELSVLLLERNRTAEVRALAEEMLPIFRTQSVEQETLAALRLFCDAAQREAATTELARRLIKFLHCAQNNPKLRFKEVGAEAPEELQAPSVLPA